MLKIFEKVGDADPATYLFHFNTAEAKEEAKAVKDLLSSLLASSRGGDVAVPKPSGASGGSSTPNQSAGGTGSGSASMAFASAVNSQQASSSRWFDDSQLKNDIELQQSLMRNDTSLHQTYVEAMQT